MKGMGKGVKSFKEGMNEPTEEEMNRRVEEEIQRRANQREEISKDTTDPVDTEKWASLNRRNYWRLEGILKYFARCFSEFLL